MTTPDIDDAAKASAAMRMSAIRAAHPEISTEPKPRALAALLSYMSPQMVAICIDAWHSMKEYMQGSDGQT